MLSTLAALTLTFMPGICNENLAERAPRPPTTKFATRALLGLNVKDARSCAKHFGWRFRVVLRDGHLRPITLDRRTDRVNVTVYHDEVFYVYVG
jgi:hypothetical protein